MWSKEAIEKQMSHQERNSVRAAYIHKAEYLEELPVDAGLQLSGCIITLQTGALPAAPPVRQPRLEIGLA
ncbi:hypothetical protein EE530_22530 [Salmonella enterica]|nr:hypothetical protein [Salmonella enterica]EAU5292314.1 hypothetical protein [Salmonella enterica]EBQ5984978.1 hypothetical protein [Salmonella enterica subsp. houtenae serovar Houten]ECS8286788.1 hypothetical protein [Salmonella enterica]